MILKVTKKLLILNLLIMKKYVMIFSLLACSLAAMAYLSGNPGDRDVFRAYELRMNGKVDEAKALLLQVLEKDSSNAMAHYEMARLSFYLLTGGGGVRLDEVTAHISKAADLEPDNVIYAYYRAVSGFMNAFMYMQMGQEDKIKGAVDETCGLLRNVLLLKPDYCEPMLYLVEIYGMLPPGMGGDSAQAAYYAGKLSETNAYFGARAREVLAPEETDLVKFWENEIAGNGRTPELLYRAAIAGILAGNPGVAEKYYNEVKSRDPSANLLQLQLGRYHMMKVMQNRELASTELPAAITCFEKYLQTLPEPVVPLKAYTLGLMARANMFLGNREEGEKLQQQATAIDKYFSRASGVPNLLLFEPPDKICHHYFSFFSPF